jgi:transcriptional regulator with XRE-family HTH domain
MRPADPARVLQGIGRRIAEIRRDRALTQEKFAEALGVSVRYIQFVEAGDENLGVETIVKIANALNVPVIDLFTPPTKPKAGPGRPKKKA